MPWVVPAPLDPSHITELFKKANGDISRSGKILQVGPASSDAQSGGAPPLTSPTMTVPGYQLDNPLSVSEANVDLSTQDKLRCLSLLRNVAMSALESLPKAVTTTPSVDTALLNSYEGEVASIATKAVNAGKRLRKKAKTLEVDLAGEMSDLSLLQSGISGTTTADMDNSSIDDTSSTIGIESIRTTCRQMLETSPDPSSHFKTLMSFLQSAMPMETSIPQPGHSWWSVGDVLTTCASDDAVNNKALSSSVSTDVVGQQQHHDDDDDDHHAPTSTRIKNLWRKVLSMFIQGLFYQDLRTCAIKVLLLRGCSGAVAVPFDRPASLPSAMLEILASRAAAKVLGAVYHSLHHYPLQVYVSIPDVYLSQPSDVHARVHQVLSTGRASSSVLTSTPGLTIRRKASHHHPDLYEGVIERYYWSQLDLLSDLISAHSLSSSSRVVVGGTTDPLVHLYRRLLGVSVLHNDVMSTILLGSDTKGGSLNTFRTHVIAPLIEATKLAIQSAMGESPIVELILPTAIQALVTVLGCTALLSPGGTGGHSDAALAAAQLIRQELVLPVMQNISLAISDYMRREAVFGGGGGGGLGELMSSYLDDDENDADGDDVDNGVDISSSVNKALRRQLTEKRRGLNDAIRFQGAHIPTPTPSSSSATSPTTQWGKLFTKSVDGTCTQLLRTVPAHRHLSIVMLSQWYLPLQTALSHIRGGEDVGQQSTSSSPVARFHRTTVFTFLFHTLRLIEGIEVSEDDMITSHVSTQGCALESKAQLASMTPKQRVEETVASIKRVFRQQQDSNARGATSSNGQLVVTDDTLLAICKQIGIPTKRLGPNTSTVLKSMQHLSGDVLQRHVDHELVHVTIPTCGGATPEEYWTVYAAEGTLYARTASQFPSTATTASSTSSSAAAAPPAAAPAGKRRAQAGVGAFGRVASGLSSRAAAVAASTSDPFKPVKSLQAFLAASGNAF